MTVESKAKFEDLGDGSSGSLVKDAGSVIFSGNGSSFFVFVVLFLVLFQTFNKQRTKKAKKLVHFEGEDNTEEYLGFEDLPAVTPWIPLKLIGNIPQLFPISDALKLGLNWAKKYGDVFTIIGLNQRIVILNSGPLVQTILKSSDFGHMTKAPIMYDPMQPFITNGVLVSKGEFWQRERKILMKSQGFQSLKAYIGMLNKHSQKFVQDLEDMFKDGKSHEINGLINIAFLGVISEMITGVNLDKSNELEEYHHNFTIWKEVLMKKILNPLLRLKPIWMFHPQAKEYGKAEKELFDFAKRRIKDHKEAHAAKTKQKDLEDFELPANGNLPKPYKLPFRSVLDELTDAGIDEKQIIDEINTMMFGGHETGASTIHYLCFALALNLKEQEQARKEVDELFENTGYFKNGQITYESVQMNLKYVERCILETLRLFPPVFMIGRKLLAPFKMEFQGKTVILSPGVNVIVSPFAIHRRADYFPEPEKFDPDRFLHDEIAARHAYSFIPFSAGPRNCLGLKFAMIEMKIITAYVLRNFELTTTDKIEDIPLLPYTTLTPAKDFTFHFKKRNV